MYSEQRTPGKGLLMNESILTVQPNQDLINLIMTSSFRVNTLMPKTSLHLVLDFSTP